MPLVPITFRELSRKLEECQKSQRHLIFQRNAAVLALTLLLAVLIFGSMEHVRTVFPFFQLKYSDDRELLAGYFVRQYITARESYHPSEYEYNYFTIVRLFSDRLIYKEFQHYIRHNSESPIKEYKKHTQTHITFDKVDLIKQSAANVHFTIHESGKYARSIKKKASITFDFMPFPDVSTTDDGYMLPLFHVTGYRVQSVK